MFARTSKNNGGNATRPTRSSLSRLPGSTGVWSRIVRPRRHREEAILCYLDDGDAGRRSLRLRAEAKLRDAIRSSSRHYLDQDLPDEWVAAWVSSMRIVSPGATDS